MFFRTSMIFYILILAMSLFGCASLKERPHDVVPNQAVQKQTEPDLGQPEPKADENGRENRIQEAGTRKEAGLRLLNEFSYYVAKIEQGNASKYNLIMASDRARGLANFNINDETAKWLALKQDEIKRNLKDSLVYSGYSVSGVHFIALTHPITQKQQAYKEAVNQLRGLEDEYDFLSDIIKRTDSRSIETSYFAVDVFAEDMFGEKKEITIKNISIPSKKSKSSSISKPNDKRLTESLSIFRREINDDLIIPNSKWKIFLFNGDSPTDEIIIQHDGELVSLRRE
ncbi:hypothetical protein QJ48_23435 [Paenibacillus sp. A3]|uniref:hypothetical protein n=1 Tax=Paenibacillus sp. A3 TaxID=1337054 RepID=UPI0006D57091|nr:hypothetical protein [Paenibacillus sp. A3]KPV57197.1 hypothetical protein QJ48_23435 [Paenibacillus sp. A3]